MTTPLKKRLRVLLHLILPMIFLSGVITTVAVSEADASAYNVKNSPHSTTAIVVYNHKGCIMKTKSQSPEHLDPGEYSSGKTIVYSFWLRAHYRATIREISTLNSYTVTNVSDHRECLLFGRKKADVDDFSPIGWIAWVRHK